jgi:hypothetical protein
MHYITDNYCWFFVDCLEGVERQTCLWRAEIPLGSLCLYMPDPRDMLNRIGTLGRIDDLTRSIFAHGGYLAQQSEEGEAWFLSLVAHGTADVLNNEICLERERREGVGCVIYDATLRAFRAARGECQTLDSEQTTRLNAVRHVWALAYTITEPPRFRLVATDIQWSSMFMRRGPISFDFRPTGNWMDNPVMELPEEEQELPWRIVTIFPPEAARLFSDYGAIARTDPFRFEGVKRLIAHAADLGLRHHPRPSELSAPALPCPVPSLPTP